MKSLVTIVVLIALFSTVSCRQSWYFGNPGSNYHPPFDLNQNIQFNNANSCVSTFRCVTPAGAVVPPAQNSSYVFTSVNTCPTPAWIPANYRYTVSTFTSCCTAYSRCLQTCGITKDYCDGQFYGCTTSSCDPQFILRPGDRVLCKAMATCYASYTTRTSTCAPFQSSQAASCICPFGSNPSVAPIPSTSSNPTTIINPTTSSNPTNPSASDVAVAGSSSAIPLPTASTTASAAASGTTNPVGKRQGSTPSGSTISASTISTSATFTGSPSPAVGDNGGSIYGNGWGSYFVRPIPSWDGGANGASSAFQNRCPPQFGNFVNVMTDQEIDDVNYWGQASSSDQKENWMKYF